MKKLDRSCGLIIFCMLIWHASGFALYEKLVEFLRDSTEDHSASKDEADGAVTLTFAKPKENSVVNIDKKTLIAAKLESSKWSPEFTVHPLTFLFYIAWFLKDKIPVEYVDEWECMEQDEQIAIVAGIYDFMDMTGSKERSPELRACIIKFLEDKLDGLNLREIENLRESNVISEITFEFLSPGIAARLRDVKHENVQASHDDYIDNKAKKLLKKIHTNKKKYIKSLLKKSARGESDPFVVIETSFTKIKLDEVDEIWSKAITDFASDSYKLEIVRADPCYGCDCDTCCLWCTCCFCNIFCFPCLFIDRVCSCYDQNTDVGILVFKFKNSGQ